jgi:hypothetical protein
LFGFALLAHSALGQSVSIAVPYQYSPNFYVGNSWTLTIAGAAASSLVQISATQNGSSLGTTSYGDTDGSGGWTLSGAFDSSTVGTWVEDFYVGGNFIGELDFTIATPTSCSYSYAGSTILNSTDYYPYDYTNPGSSTIYQYMISGPCSFVGSSGGDGYWITSSYTANSSEVTWSVADGGEASPYACPRCDPYINYDYYPLLDYATLSSNVYNSETNTIQVFNTEVVLYIAED